MFDYVKSQATANKLLKQFGKQWTIKRIVNGEYDPDTGTVPTTELTSTPYSVLLDYRSGGMDFAENTLIQAGDKKLLVSAQGLSFDIAQGDLAINGSEQWKIINVKTLKPADTVVMYECQVRK